MIHLWKKYCKCGRGIVDSVNQCSYCDEMDGRHAQRKAMVQQQRALNKKRRVVFVAGDLPKLVALLDNSFYVSFEKGKPRHLASHQPLEENALFIQDLLGGYVFDRSLFDFTDHQGNGYEWHSRTSDLHSLIEFLWSMLPAHRQLYLIKHFLEPPRESLSTIP